MPGTILVKKDYVIGINYFCGWWREKPNKYAVVSDRDWRLDFPERIPLLGCYNDQATMDSEINEASAYGVDYFQMLWYVQEPVRDENVHHLNDCIEQFMKSPNNMKMSFSLEFCNHPPFEIIDDAIWAKSIDCWIGVMKHPQYLRLNGRPLFKIHGLSYFYEQNNKDFNKAKSKIDLLRRRALENGVGQLLISGGVMSSGLNENEINAADLVDFLSTYMDIPELPVRDDDYPYENLIEQAQNGRKIHALTSPKPYMPYIPSGWNPKPWGDPRPNFKFPNNEEWENALSNIKNDLDHYPNLKVPDGSGGQKMFSIYAWNEFGEGGIIAPTLGENHMKLEAIKKILKR